MESGDRYLKAQRRFVRLIEAQPDDLLIPATPGWSLHSLLAHVVGVATDIVSGHVDRWSQPEWTAAQVQSRAGAPRSALLGEWGEQAPNVAAIVDDPSSFGLHEMYRRLPLVDVLAHEHDVREAVGDDRDIDDADWTIIGLHRRFWLDAQCEAARLAPLHVVTDEGDDWVVGGDAPAGELRTRRRELWRSLEGRRTRDAVRAFDWDVDPEPYLDVWLGPAFQWSDAR